jgi:uncharacterized membrane-anchored protein
MAKRNDNFLGWIDYVFLEKKTEEALDIVTNIDISINNSITVILNEITSYIRNVNIKLSTINNQRELLEAYLETVMDKYLEFKKKGLTLRTLRG